MQIRMVMVYGNGGNRALIVTKDKDVFTLNYNEDDNFKTGDTHFGLYPKKIEELCGKNIKTFACNSCFILALTEEGEVYSWGFNKKRGSDHALLTFMRASTPTRVADLSEKRIVDIACGSDHFLALTSDGRVYAWGKNKSGQIGNGFYTYSDDYSSPTQVKHELEGKKIVHIACGSMFNMGVTDKGKLYGWGDNESGQILIDTIPYTIDSITDKHVSLMITLVNFKSEKYYVHPREITTISGKAIVKVACGLQHALALTCEGKLYAWGKNDRGQLGVNKNLQFSAPVLVDVPELVLDIAAYDNLSVVVGSNRTVYVWGDCFGEVITTPFPTKFSRIHDAFAFSSMRVMHKPLTVSPNNDVEEVLNILDSLRFGDLGKAFDDPVRLLSFFCMHFFALCSTKPDI
ncbi:rcc1 and btb domain-containing protein 1 [Lasius niger]|uniref:Rcc1 and btb domain-containing protein 1 n=1 Tax=Lasius niger TaxID=67767 RepID=A0A0J7KIF2_LASNI|nr:rcc1 and btb domain-containing protein 1 [Lasius niger]